MAEADPRPEVLVAITVDVEEEGLFRGGHPRQASGLANVAHLRRLAFISRRFGLPLTLLATYPVLQDPACRDELLSWRDDWGAELGAHLHVWNTPPFAAGEPWQAQRLPASVLRAKLDRLLEGHRNWLGGPASSFRMGRFDLTTDLMPYLALKGITVDSSLVPLRWQGRQGPPFLVPPDPHPLTAARIGSQVLWEAPLTVLPVWTGTERAAYDLAQVLPRRSADRLLRGFRYVAAAGVQPTMFSGPAMRLATRLHLKRGGRVLTMFLHSSELMPGGSPAYASEEAVLGLLGKMDGFLDWLTRRWPVRGVTLGQLPLALGPEGGCAP